MSDPHDPAPPAPPARPRPAARQAARPRATPDAPVDRALTLSRATGGRWLQLVGAMAALILLMTYAIVLLVLVRDGFSNETRALLLGQVVIMGFSTVVGFLFGSSLSSKMQAARRMERPGPDDA